MNRPKKKKKKKSTEIEIVIKYFPTNKCSGLDNFRVGEFFHKFREKLIPILFKVFQKISE